MAWIKLKQYLENSWYRWASQDRQTWYAAQFQYGENINIRDMKNGVCLSWWRTDVSTKSKPFNYFTYKNHLYYVDADWKIYDENWTQKCATWIAFTDTPNWIEFWNYIYIVWDSWVIQVDSSWNYTNLTSLFPVYDWDNFRYIWWCVLNYANTYLLIWDWNIVWKMDTATWTPVFTGIRDFESSYTVYWLTQEWNYLKIYTSNWINTKIHYAKGTFDVEYTWLIQTVSFKWLSIDYWCVCSDQGTDYAVFSFAPRELKLAKISGYNKTDIRWTQTWEWSRIFTSITPYIIACDWVVFAATDEWVWTFTEYNWWLWWGCVEFKENQEIISIFRFGERLYACISNWSNWYISCYYDLSFHPTKYQSNGFIIGRVFDGGCAWLFKKNDQATITYNMPVGTSMELSYRYDRSSFGYAKSDFFSIKKLTDTNECYDIVVPTTPQVDKQSWLLAMENWSDLILLENWNWIQLEEMMVCPFNKTWNLLEYRFDLNTSDTSKTPTLYEHSLTYYDYMRKYR